MTDEDMEKDLKTIKTICEKWNVNSLDLIVLQVACEVLGFGRNTKNRLRALADIVDSDIKSYPDELINDESPSNRK